MKLYQNLLDEYEKGLLGYAAIGIIGQSCLGSYASMKILMNGTSFIEMIQLFIVIIFSMGYNAAILSQQKPKMSFNILIASILVSMVAVLINII